MIKTPFTGAVVKNVSMSGADANFSGNQLDTSDLTGPTDAGVPIMQFHEVAPPPMDVKEINPDVFGMKLGKGSKG